MVYVQCSTAPSRSAPLFLVHGIALSLASQIVQTLILLAIERPEGWLVQATHIGLVCDVSKDGWDDRNVEECDSSGPGSPSEVLVTGLLHRCQES